jgi:hypothetical protein
MEKNVDPQCSGTGHRLSDGDWLFPTKTGPATAMTGLENSAHNFD